MAIGKASDFKIYDDQLNGGMVETLVQQTAAFNAASRGGIRLVTNRLRGNYEYESFFQNISSLVTRRDTTSVAAATDLALPQDEHISVKINRKVGPVAQTLDAFRKIGRGANEQSLSFLVGTMIAKAMQVDQLDNAIRAGVATIGAQSTLIHNVGSTLSTSDLVDGLSKMGDMASRVVVWVMHSAAYYDLVKEQISANIDGVANFNVATATPITLNRPVIVTDSAALTATGSPDDPYYTLGLVADGIVVEDSEEELMHAEIVTGLENLVVRLQGEFAYNLGVKGAQWDVANGGANPTNAAVATTTNWDKVAADVKDMCGVRIDSYS
jgi:hypothetical protein